MVIDNNKVQETYNCILKTLNNREVLALTEKLLQQTSITSNSPRRKKGSKLYMREVHGVNYEFKLLTTEDIKNEHL